MKFQPIIRLIEGLDDPSADPQERRLLTQKETEELKGDWFGEWLSQTPVENRALTLRNLLNRALPTGTPRWTFGIAEGTPIRYNRENPDDPLNLLSRHMRFLIITHPVPPPQGESPGLGRSGDVQTVFIVAGSSPDGDGSGSGEFLQVASWDPNGLGERRGLMRFYQRTNEGWVFVGSGLHAFLPETAGKGVFMGHVGGAVIMKELVRPWTHWFDDSNRGAFQASLGSTRDGGSRCDPHNVLFDPLFTENRAFSRLGRAETLEGVVKSILKRWYRSRFYHDFVNPENEKPREHISTCIKQWVGHILCTRSINIATSQTSTARVRQAESLDGVDLEGIPVTLFLDVHGITSGSMLRITEGGFRVAAQHHQSAVDKLGIALFHGGNTKKPPTVPMSEGPFTFPIIEPGIEDCLGVSILLTMAGNDGPGGGIQLLPRKAIASMLMVDFCNPVYSARRERLMEYVPNLAVFDSDTRSYNVLDQMIANIRASDTINDPKSGERELLDLLETPDAEWETVFANRVNNYLRLVRSNLSKPSMVESYMVLAEGKRRLYRGREAEKPNGQGLNEFPLTLPFAIKPDPFPINRMQEDGEIAPMSPEDIDFFMGNPREPGGSGSYLKFSHDAGSSGVCPVMAY